MRAKVAGFVASVAVAVAVSSLLGLRNDQVASLTVFSSMILGTLFFWGFRLAFAFLGLAALLGLGLLDIAHLIEFAGLDIILFLVGMMIVIGFLEERHFFEYLVDAVVVRVGNDAYRVTLVMMVMAALSAALVDEVTSILFMTATMLHLTGKHKVNPVPFIIMLVFATNIGSSATVVGNPVGVIIALRAGLTFRDFLRWATPISMLALAAAVPISLQYFRGDIRKLQEGMKSAPEEAEEEESETRNESRRGLTVSWALFLGTIISLVLHHQVEELLHLERNSMLLGTAVVAAGIALLLDFREARELVERRVDWWTLLFFVMLFASVGTLAYVGVTGVIAQALLNIPGGSLTLMVVFILVAALLSAFMDNVLAVATLVPIVKDLAAYGVQEFPLWWGLLFASTFFGNLTLIGSTANIVAIGMIERRKLGMVTFIQWIKVGALVAIPTLALAVLLLYLQLGLMPP
ncbi:MAG: SLC13 family permease [Candidatus Bathyarchaeia archaeon]